MKKIVIALLAVILVISCVVGIVACDKKGANVLENYIFELEGTTVSEDFVLPATIGGQAANWTSDNVAITLTKNEKDWTAAITHPETGIVEVTLTVTAGSYSKSFKVSVKAIDVYDIADNYTFVNNKATVTSDFELDSIASFKGKTANVTWTVDEAYSAYIGIDGNYCRVTPQSEPTDVAIKATFTYGEDSTTIAYRMTIYKTMEGLELVDYWYSNTGVSITMSGYVVEIGTEYSESYNNVTLYMVNDDFTAGFYLYRVKADVATGTALRPGVHVTCTGTTNTNYNGLIETNAGGNIVIDADIAPIDVREHVKAIDDELIGNVPATIYNESRLVSLSNWKVKEVKTADLSAGGNQTILVLEKSKATVSVAVSKYVSGAYADKDDTYQAICNTAAGYSVGDVVSVTGIWSNYKGWQIIPLAVSDITTGTADPDGTTYAGDKVAAAVSEVNARIEAEGLNTRVTEALSVNLPTTSGDVEIAYTAINSKSVVVGENGLLTLTPGNPEQTTLQVTYTCGEFTTVQFFYIKSLVPTAATIMDDLAELVPETIKQVTDLPTIDGIEITWEVKNAGDNNNISINNGQLIPVLEEEEVKVSITATLTYNEVTKTKTFYITIAAGKGPQQIDMASVAEDTGYVLAINQVNLGKSLYAINQLSGNYIATTDDPEKAELVYVEIVKDAEETAVIGYRLYFKAKDGTKTYISTKIGKNSSNKTTGYMDLVTENAAVWTYDATTNSLYTPVDLGTAESPDVVNHYFGTYSTFNTISLSKSSYISESNTGVSQFPGFLATIAFKPLTSNEIKVSASEGASVENLSKTSGLNGEKFTFTVSVENNYSLTSVKVGNTTLEPDVQGVYTGTISGATTITVVATPLLDTPEKIVNAAYELQSGATLGEFTLTGVVKSIDTAYSTQYGNITVTIVVGDLTEKPIVCFRMIGTGAENIAVNDTITVTGTITNYNGTIEFTSGCTLDARTAGTSTVGVDSASSANATVTITDGLTSGTNGTTFTFTVVAASGHEIVSVKVNGSVVEAVDGTYTGTINGNTLILVETKEEGAATAQVVSSLAFPNANNQKIGSYTATWTAYNDSDETWTIDGFNNNNNGWSLIKCGRKGNASVASIATGSAMADAITKIVIDFASITTANVNSAKLVVATDAAFTENVQEIDFTSSLAAGEVTVNVGTPTANCYYKLVFDCASGSANGFVQINSIDYYAVK